MLFRLNLLGVDVGERWIEIADKAETRIGDCLSAFTLPHWTIALAASGREQAAERMLDGMRAFAAVEGTLRRIVGGIAFAGLRSRPCASARRICPCHHSHAGRWLGDMHQLGRPVMRQQDVADAALPRQRGGKADCADDVHLILRRAGRSGSDLKSRVGYAQAVLQFMH